TGGGVPLDVEPALAVALPSAPEFTGINQITADEFMSAREFIDAVNFEGASKRGSFRKRRGFQKFVLSAGRANNDGVRAPSVRLLDGTGSAVVIATTFNGTDTETIDAVGVSLPLRSIEKPPVAPTVVFAQNGAAIDATFAVSEIGGVEKAFLAISLAGYP